MSRLIFCALLLAVSSPTAAQQANCPLGGEEQSLGLGHVIAQSFRLISQSRRAGILTIVIRIDPQAWQKVRIVKTTPDPSRRPRWLTRGWLAYSIRGCPYISTLPPPADVTLAIQVRSRLEGGLCRGSRGVALLDPYFVRRVGNNRLRC